MKRGLTFDDVLLMPGYSEVLPSEVSLKTELVKGINLNIPITSAAMDTVTESKLAIAIAREGGIGFIHKNMNILEQAKEVDLVKRSQSGMITNPVTLKKDNTLKDAEDIMQTFKISGIPIIDDTGLLLGIVTNRDLRYRVFDNTLIDAVMTKKNLVTAKVGTTLEEAKTILMNHRLEKLLIVDENFKLKGLITSKDINNVLDYPNAAKDNQGRLLCGEAVSPSIDVLDRVSALVNSALMSLLLIVPRGILKMY